MHAELLARLQTVGQEHLLAFWDVLDEAARHRLAAQIGQLDFELLSRLVQGEEASLDWEQIALRARPPKAIRLHQKNRIPEEAALEVGERALRGGKMGMILVAGGQGTRLGFDQPKGMFRLGPVSNRTLFQILIERLHAVSLRYRVSIPLYLMTSPVTHEATLEFLDENERFGFPAEDLKVFCQGVMPAIDAETGRLLLAGKGELFLSPDGHGGMLAALVKSGCLADAASRGVEQLFFGQIDNPLLQVCDPLLTGYHLVAESELTTQVVKKVDPLERVGNVVEVDERTRIIEYSDLPDAIAKQRTADHELHLWAGNLAVHVFDVAFLARAHEDAEALPFHRALKRASYVDARGERVEPAKPNAVKFERFIFDLLPWAERALVVEAAKEDAFAPVKNATGTDSPDTARTAMVRQHTKMLTDAGATVAPGTAVEINPFWALDAAQVASRIQPGTRITKPTYFHEGMDACSTR